jgi:hypothetical protein
LGIAKISQQDQMSAARTNGMIQNGRGVSLNDENAMIRETQLWG